MQTFTYYIIALYTVLFIVTSLLLHKKVEELNNHPVLRSYKKLYAYRGLELISNIFAVFGVFLLFYLYYNPML